MSLFIKPVAMSYFLHYYCSPFHAELQAVVACPKPVSAGERPGQRFGAADGWPLPRSLQQRQHSDVNHKGKSSSDWAASRVKVTIAIFFILSAN
jgi:hypothetical protein